MMIPGAPEIKKEKKIVHVTHINNKNDLNILIQFDMASFVVQIGPYNHSNNVPLHTLVSNTGVVNIHYYESELIFTPQIEQWLGTFLDNLEILVPGKLGIVIELLQFIIQDKDKYPTDLDKNIIKTILVSHDVFFECNKKIDISTLSHAYGEENAILMLGLIEMIENDPLVKLHEMVLKFKKNIVTTMSALLILEVHGVVTIHRPDIISDNIDLNSSLS